MENLFEYYRIKMTFQKESDTGAIETVKTEELVMATCYTDAEKIAITLMQDKQQFGVPSYEIVKTKIKEVLYNDTFKVDTTLTCGLITYYFEDAEESEVGLYAVSVIMNFVDEKTGKVKPSKSAVYVPASNPQEAIALVNKHIEEMYVGFESFVTRTVRYDKAQSVMVTPEVYQSQANA